VTASCPRLTASQLWLTVSLITNSSEFESHVTTDGQSASLSWNKAPIWGLRPDFHYCQTVAGLLMWGALSDERTGLSFTTAAGPGHPSHSRVWVPWDSWPYFTLSYSRLPFSSPPTIHRATVEVCDSTSAQTNCFLCYNFEKTEKIALPVCVCFVLATPAIPWEPSNARERVYTCYPGNKVFPTICCNGDMITEPLSSNGHIAPASIFHLSGDLSQYYR
jgi:hypothetical protein